MSQMMHNCADRGKQTWPAKTGDAKADQRVGGISSSTIT
jgi:hypothetical protein